LLEVLENCLSRFVKVVVFKVGAFLGDFIAIGSESIILEKLAKGFGSKWHAFSFCKVHMAKFEEHIIHFLFIKDGLKVSFIITYCDKG